MRILAAPSTLLALAVLACDNGAGPLKSNVQVSFATRSPAAAPSVARAASSDTLTDGASTIVITKAQVVLRRIELKRAETATCGSGVSGGCEDVELGPLLVDLPLTPGVQQQFSVAIPAGTYDEIDFEVHKVTTQDPATLQNLLLNRSIHVEGTFDGQPFTFESELDVEQELALSPALAVTDTTTLTNVTIRIVLDAWFRAATGGTLLDPRNESNRSVITENIKTSMKGFRDDDHDGKVDP